jgi:hypothetical protein
MAHALCMLDDVTDTHSERVIIVVFLLQQWLSERAGLSVRLYVHCLLVDSTTVQTQRKMLDRILTLT